MRCYSGPKFYIWSWAVYVMFYIQVYSMISYFHKNQKTKKKRLEIFLLLV